MITLVLSGLRARKRRLASSLLAVLLGVSFLAGTLILSDTLGAAIDGFFTRAYQNTDVTLRNATKVSDRPGTPRGMIDDSVIGTVRRVPGVAIAEPVIQGAGQLLDMKGSPISSRGPRVAGNWVAGDGLNPYRIVQGRPPRTNGEAVINRGLAKDGALRVGDTTALMTPERVPVRIVGIATFGSDDGFGGTAFTALTLDDARKHLAKRPDRVSSVSVKAAPGVSREALRSRIEAVIPRGVEAITGDELAAEGMSEVDRGFVRMFRAFLLVFAGVALLVGTFSIFNTFSIIVAQRSAESALLRAVGASRRQIMASVVLEAFAVGGIASAAGVGGGLGIAAALKALFSGFGLGLPAEGLVISGTTVAVAVTAGVAVTLVAAALPAVRASRVPPIAALRDVAAEPPRVPPARVLLGGALAAVAIATALTGAFRGSMPLTGAGALVTIAALVALGPAAARRAGALLGTPVARVRGVAGSLARDNATRNPRRTAGAATALMIGVGVVTLITVVAASLQKSVDDGISTSFRGDLVVDRNSLMGGFDPRLGEEVARLPQVAAAAGVGTGTAVVGGSSATVTVADPVRLRRVLNPVTSSGSLPSLGPDGLAVDTEVAGDHGWRVGSPVPLRFADGATRTFTVGAIYRPSRVVGGYLIGRTAWAAHNTQVLDAQVFITLRPGVTPEQGRAAVERAARPYGSPAVRTRQEYVAGQTQPMRQLLGIVYVMLALAIVIALLGIANTLSLAVHERTRELGLLRAVGATRSQLRSMIRWESVMVALLGTAEGLGIGVFLGWALVRAAAGDGTVAFAAPLARLLLVLAVGALAGVVAASRPARRAARLSPLSALAVR